jgi:hypothetical protein
MTCNRLVRQAVPPEVLLLLLLLLLLLMLLLLLILLKRAQSEHYARQGSWAGLPPLTQPATSI